MKTTRHIIGLGLNVVSLTSEVKSLALEVKPLVFITLALRALFFILIGLR